MLQTKSFHLVAIDKHLIHDHNKVCFNWNIEPREDQRDKDILEKFPKYSYSYRAIDDNQNNICSACLWYNEPYHGPKQVVYDSYNVDCETSKYSLNTLLRGKINNKYNQEYGPILTITSSHYNDMQKNLLSLKDPINKNDIDIFADTKSALAFINKWLNHDNVEILCISDI